MHLKFILQVFVFLLVITISLNCNNPTTNQNSKISPYGKWKPKISYTHQSNIDGQFISLDTMDIDSFFTFWNIRKITEIDSDSIAIYTYTTDTTYRDVSFLTKHNDTMYCYTNFHNFSKKQNSKCYIDREWFVLESKDTIDDIMKFVILQKTYFEPYEGALFPKK